MEGLIVGIVVLGVGLVAALGATIFLWKGRHERVKRIEKLSNELNEVRRQQWELKSKLESDQGYKALTAQVEELRKLRDNLNGQVELAKVELRGAEDQIESAKTQFTDWTGAAAQVKSDLELQQSKLKGLMETGEAEVKEALKLRSAEADRLVASEAAQKRAEAEAELVKYLAELNKEVAEKKESCALLSKERDELAQKANELQKLNDRIAAEHAEALRRDSLEQGEGGRMTLDDSDKHDADDLRRLCRGMRCENAVLKATYDVYVKPEIERLVRDQGVSGVSGIYRIWRKDGERELSYIGQAVDVGERWKTHAKRAWGVDNTGRIKLYQEMMRSGIEEWHWELVEDVAVPQLSEREKYWGEFYAVKDIGLNSKLG